MLSASTLFVAFTITQAAPPPAPPAPPQAANVRFAPVTPPGEARLVEVRGDFRGVVVVSGAAKVPTEKRRTEVNFRMVDTFTDPGADVWHGTRHFVQAEVLNDGQVDDPEFTGLDADLVLGKNGSISWKTRGERLMSQHALDMLLAAGPAFGLQVTLPAELAVGDECKIDFSSLAPWCFDLDGMTKSATAKLKFSAVDEKTNVARFSGDADVESEIGGKDDHSSAAAAGATGKAHYHGRVELDYDLTGQRVVRVACVGSGKVDAALVAQSSQITIDSTSDVKITAAVGPAVAAAAKERPRVRDVPHRLAKAGIVLPLPSHYFDVPPGDPKRDEFFNGVDGQAKAVHVVVLGFAEAGTEFATAAASFKTGLEKVDGVAKVTEAPVASGLGPGRAFDFTRKGDRAVAYLLPVAPGRFVSIQFVTAADAFAEQSKAWPKFLAGVKKLH